MPDSFLTGSDLSLGGSRGKGPGARRPPAGHRNRTWKGPALPGRVGRPPPRPKWEAARRPRHRNPGAGNGPRFPTAFFARVGGPAPGFLYWFRGRFSNPRIGLAVARGRREGTVRNTPGGTETGEAGAGARPSRRGDLRWPAGMGGRRHRRPPAPPAGGAGGREGRPDGGHPSLGASIGSIRPSTRRGLAEDDREARRRFWGANLPLGTPPAGRRHFFRSRNPPDSALAWRGRETVWWRRRKDSGSADHRRGLAADRRPSWFFAMPGTGGRGEPNAAGTSGAFLARWRHLLCRGRGRTWPDDLATASGRRRGRASAAGRRTRAAGGSGPGGNG